MKAAIDITLASIHVGNSDCETINELVELLQSCLTLDEAHEQVAQAVWTILSGKETLAHLFGVKNIYL
ncbi:MAG TPA: hypothetical protein VGU64_02350 [Terriglobales bacterium]|nr:hypothetical protein [Terriglobales bacterium]